MDRSPCSQWAAEQHTALSASAVDSAQRGGSGPDSPLPPHPHTHTPPQPPPQLFSPFAPSPEVFVTGHVGAHHLPPGEQATEAARHRQQPADPAGVHRGALGTRLCAGEPRVHFVTCNRSGSCSQPSSKRGLCGGATPSDGTARDAKVTVRRCRATTKHSNNATNSLISAVPVPVGAASPSYSRGMPHHSDVPVLCH